MELRVEFIPRDEAKRRQLEYAEKAKAMFDRAGIKYTIDEHGHVWPLIAAAIDRL